ncbi:glycosyltransferase family 2 protein [Tepidibacillus sp. HK-1]|uniref:glycosyltransferase family 2 protein n=1 Tax=Tepidibacillus sp. HK-1 TaxID=1883407 RepID=UPI0008536150|nr:glycosyltransferase [Tepidibacillus sp. HK-1]GBF12334.1 chondroitin synthase [Tepidibacillus sp. HK-1]
MKKDVSIIMPSYNKYPLNLFSLYALANQKYDLSKMEVILIDDASTDLTPKLKSFKAPFKYHYIRYDKNLGRSKARNVGISLANGSVIIFLDSEIIVDSHFVANHLENHSEEENMVVTGALRQYGVYTTLYPDFRNDQIEKFYSLIRGKPLLLRRWQLIPGNHLRNLKTIRKRLKQAQKPIPLLSQKEIKSRFYQQLTFPKPLFADVRKHFGDQLIGYHLPWQAFLSGNVSLKKELLDKVGYFDEDYQGWGLEDTDMGYRLYKIGAVLKNDQGVPHYHQEHPFSTQQQHRDMFKNYLIYQRKHPEFETSTHAMTIAGYIDRLEEQRILEEYKQLNQEYPNQFMLLKETYLLFLHKVAELLAEEKKINHLSFQIGLDDQPEKKNQVLTEEDTIKKLEKFDLFIDTFHMLFHL